MMLMSVSPALDSPRTTPPSSPELHIKDAMAPTAATSGGGAGSYKRPWSPLGDGDAPSGGAKRNTVEGGAHSSPDVEGGNPPSLQSSFL